MPSDSEFYSLREKFMELAENFEKLQEKVKKLEAALKQHREDSAHAIMSTRRYK